jgi:RNA polymerase sigma-70 factor (ECF subfamily)
MRREPLDSNVTDLVEQARGGDRGAFVALYGRYSSLVRHVIRDNVRDGHAVDDIVQEVFTRALEQLPTLRQSDRFSSWLLAIARHAAIDSRRARVRSPQLVDTDDVDLDAGEPGPAELAELAELADVVRSCVVGLSARDTAAVVMVTYLGFTTAEVATALGLSYGAAKVAVHRARSRLRRALSVQVLVRQAFPACSAFEQCVHVGDLVGAARHTDGCGICHRAVAADLCVH